MIQDFELNFIKELLTYEKEGNNLFFKVNTNRRFSIQVLVKYVFLSEHWGKGRNLNLLFHKQTIFKMLVYF